MGIGGTPEGVISAAAIKCLRGAIQGKLWPRNDEERQALDRLRLRPRPGADDRRPRLRRGRLRRRHRRHERRLPARRARQRRRRRDRVDRDALALRHRAPDRRLPPFREGPTTDERRPRWPRHELHETARALVADDKGILAADESSGTIEKRFDSIELESTEENRRAYRDMLFTTPGLEEFVSGVILFDETLRQSAADGTPFAELPRRQGDHPRDQGRHRRQGARRRARREGDRGARRAARAAAGVPRARRPLRQVARRDHDRGRHPDGLLHPGQRARARPLRGALPGAGDRPDRRARGADGRRQRHRDVLPRDQADAAQGLRRALPPARRPRRGSC